jgi:hypothetical protein
LRLVIGGDLKATVLTGKLKIMIFEEVVHEDDEFAHAVGELSPVTLDSYGGVNRVSVLVSVTIYAAVASS